MDSILTSSVAQAGCGLLGSGEPWSGVALEAENKDPGNSCWDPQAKARAPEKAALPLLSYVIHSVVNSYPTKNTLSSQKWVQLQGGVQSSLGVARGCWAQLPAKGISELGFGG